MLFLEFLKPFSVVNLIPLSLTLLVSAYFIKDARVNQGSYYSAFWVEGIPVFWLLVWLLIKIFL